MLFHTVLFERNGRICPLEKARHYHCHNLKSFMINVKLKSLQDTIFFLRISDYLTTQPVNYQKTQDSNPSKGNWHLMAYCHVFLEYCKDQKSDRRHNDDFGNVTGISNEGNFHCILFVRKYFMALSTSCLYQLV